MASIVSSRLSTRFALRASKLLEESFICRRCLHQRNTSTQKSITQSPFLTAFKEPGHYKIRYSTAVLPGSSEALRPLAQRTAESIPKSKSQSSSFPHVSSKYVAYWLLGSAASVFGIVIFGGLTRLTESGLSITEWKPITGSVPPRLQEEWEDEFARYKQSPEFVMLNSRMDLDDFKKIYWMEWIHRQWGRIVGITFLLPTIGFIATKKVSKPMALKLTGICGLIGFQGFLGWWMVKSGLKDDLFAPGSHPRVSQYRLAAHLGTAFLAYTAMLYNGLRILQAHKMLALDETTRETLFSLSKSPQLKVFRRSVAALSGLIFITVMSGAFVAGLDAGLVYNDFPWMGQGLIPPKSELLDTFYSHTPSHSDLVWRNMLENPVLAQLDHRILATTTFCSVLALYGYSRFGSVRPLLQKLGAAKSALGLVHLVSLQVTLGITTLWYLVPTPLASAHQGGALLLLSGAVLLVTRSVMPKSFQNAVRNATGLAQKTGSSKAAQHASQRLVETSREGLPAYKAVV